MKKIFDIHTLAHFAAGVITATCLLHPDGALAILTSVLCFSAFLIYEVWEDKRMFDHGQKDWWEYMFAYYVTISILLAKSLA